MKYPKKKVIKFEAGDNYLADKIRLIINKLGEVILISTTMTVLRVESDDTHTVESMELSQKQHTHRQNQIEQEERDRAYFENITNKTNSMLM